MRTSYAVVDEISPHDIHHYVISYVLAAGALCAAAAWAWRSGQCCLHQGAPPARRGEGRRRQRSVATPPPPRPQPRRESHRRQESVMAPPPLRSTSEPDHSEVLSASELNNKSVLGKRTKFQQNVLPQLALSSELAGNMERPSAEDSHGNAELPAEIELDDDTRLNKIQQYLQKSQPKDDLATEELQPYIELILSQKRGAWSCRVAALLIRCKLESTHKRTVERAMLQCESVVSDKSLASNTTR
ncbi:Tetratricopeptide repeat protein 27 [Operophtera brumata]|uniref:Tetratricopeptide repeat protein 27 n=1 Tax=Operophtera brumata TaxID=104452 RepID=A0A0L7L8N4_OPEBR|nr:Tetratricopeptide repeat protein 27 [Operophtera brumata]